MSEGEQRMSCPNCEQERKTEKQSQWIRNADLSIEFSMIISITFKGTHPVTFLFMMNKMIKSKNYNLLCIETDLLLDSIIKFAYLLIGD